MNIFAIVLGSLKPLMTSCGIILPILRIMVRYEYGFQSHRNNKNKIICVHTHAMPSPFLVPFELTVINICCQKALARPKIEKSTKKVGRYSEQPTRLVDCIFNVKQGTGRPNEWASKLTVEEVALQGET